MQESKTDLWSALFMFVIGLATAIGSLNYEIGTLANMGPGYFPLIAGIALLLVSGLIFIKGLATYYKSKEFSSKTKANCINLRPRWRVWFFIIAAMLAFVLLSRYVGLEVATFVTVVLAALADPANSWKNILLLASALTAFVVLVFYYFLQIQIPLWLVN